MRRDLASENHRDKAVLVEDVRPLPQFRPAAEDPVAASPADEEEHAVMAEQCAGERQRKADPKAEDHPASGMNGQSRHAARQHRRDDEDGHRINPRPGAGQSVAADRARP